MNKFLVPFLCLLLLAVAANAQSKEEAAVAAAVEKFNQAMVSADRSQLNQLTAGELSYGHSSGKVQDKVAFVDDVVDGAFDFLTIAASDQSILLAGNTAIVRHVFSSEATNNGTPVRIKIGNMLVWQKQKGQWKLLARQAFKL
ncbi:nuclear transport factor 2 family protein [Pontibacter sp. E15-1]|uniref:nuclear transport factor 2 family protein n=1 Tax=Pontibacter sp. E15-1 TaxID=2919918 RepID=UPI001F4FEF2A|nr:nuclear transport factor 2 family protein [Pontibacter sp. E15-1]MCJ8164059.1 nuclear transport factor 2 family protein [Pontibacter sp. E15-1]